MLHRKPLHPAANSGNVHGLGIAEQRIIASHISVQPEAFHAIGQDLLDNHPQDVNLHTEYAPGQRPGRNTRYDTALPILTRVRKEGMLTSLNL